MLCRALFDNGRRNEIKAALASGKDIASLFRARHGNDEKEQRRARFFEAAKDGNVLEVSRLLGLGIDVDAKDQEGLTALAYAGLNNHVDIVELLIKNGADVNAKSKYDESVLSYASDEGGNRATEVMRSHGARN